MSGITIVVVMIETVCRMRMMTNIHTENVVKAMAETKAEAEAEVIVAIVMIGIMTEANEESIRVNHLQVVIIIIIIIAIIQVLQPAAAAAITEENNSHGIDTILLTENVTEVTGVPTITTGHEQTTDNTKINSQYPFRIKYIIALLVCIEAPRDTVFLLSYVFRASS